MKNTHFNLRMSENEKKELKKLAKKSKMNMSEFIRHAVFNKEIIIIDGIDELRKDLKRIGNNINQITTRANAGQFHTVYLHETKEELTKIHNKISELCSYKNSILPEEISKQSAKKNNNEQMVQPQKENTTPNEINSKNLKPQDKTLTAFNKPKLNNIFGRKKGN